MTNRNRVRLSQLSLGLAIALAAAPAFAQNTTSAVGGRIVGSDSQPVAGAQVTIVHAPSGTVSSAVTGADGRYSARGLRVGGPYTITIVKDGVSETREGVYLQLAETTAVDATLGEETTTLAAVEVTGSATLSEIFSSTNMGAGTQISREQLEGFASIQRNLQDYARLDPRLSQTDKERGEISVAGQNSRYNTITIDAVATNDTFGLEANNLPTLKQPISIDAIESVQVNVSNYDVTQKGYTGANINAVTKSGTNEFSGSAYYVYRNDSMAGDRFVNGDYVDPPEAKEDIIGATFGGPLIKDNLFFFISYEDFTSTRGGPAAGPVGSDRFNVAVTPAEIAAAQAIASNTWGMDIGTADAPAAELKVEDILIKLDANLGEQHRASLRWSRTEQSEPLYPSNFTTGGVAMSLSSHWYNQDKTIESWVGQVFSDWTDTFSTEFKASFRDYDSAPVNASTLPQMRLNFAGGPLPGGPANTSAGLLFGTERSRQFNDLATETWNYYAAANWFLGDHELKFGVDYDDNDVYNAFLQDTSGNYTFDCINGSSTFQYTTPGLTGNFSCSALSRTQYSAAVLENFRRGRPLSYAVQVGINGFGVEDGVAEWDYQNLGLFLQDTWAVNYNLTVTAGIRFDQKSMGVLPEFNAAANAAAVPGRITGSTLPQNGTAIRATGGFGYDNTEVLDGNSLFQPRVGFNYTFDSDRPTQLRGGVGLFEGAAANVWLSNPYSNTGRRTGIVSCSGSGSTACPRTDNFFSPDPFNQPGIAGSPPAPNVDILSPDLEQPTVWKANLAFDHELPFLGMTVSVEYLKTVVENAVYYRHLNIGAPVRQGADGRDLFYHPVAYNGSCFSYNSSGNLVTSTSGACAAPAGASRTRALSNSAFNNVLLAENTSKGGGDNLSLTLSGAFAEDWSWSLGYSYTEATEVSPLTSSVANSNWQSVSVFNTNEEEEANSAYLVKDRFVGQLNWSRAFFGDYRTRAGLFYEGRRGKPYSWIYNNDLNGDGVTNDLMYIPTAFGSGDVVFRDVNNNGSGRDEEVRFWDIVNANGLNRFAGEVTDRNADFAPWTNTFDLRISQEMPGFFEGNKTVLTLDILNIGNLINKDWGRIDEIGFQPAGGLARSFVDYAGLTADGRYIYGVNGVVEGFTTRQTSGESQWAAQFTLRYEF